VPVVVADTRRPTFESCGCPHVGFVGASVRADTRRPLYLGAASNCGPRPVITNYGRGADRDTASYHQDLIDYEACIRANPVAHAAAPAAPANSPGARAASTDQQIIDHVLSPYTGLQTYQYWRDFVSVDMANGQLDSGGNYASGAGSCAGSGGASPTMQEAAAGLNVAGAGATAGLAIAHVAGSAIPLIGAGIAVFDLFMWLFGKRHAYSNQLVHILCHAVPTVNQVLQQIDAELQSGLIDANKAASALGQLQSAFENVIAPVKYQTSGNYAQTGDDAELLDASLAAIVLKREQTYPAIAKNIQAQIAAQKAAAAAAQQAQIQAAANQAVAAALAKQTPKPPALVPVSTSSAAPAQPTGPSPVVAAPSASGSWFSGSTFGIPTWALLLGGAVLLMGE
jgi:hypothetical protein